ncbi:DsrE family protein [Parvularcula marina]|uniref:Uncharacterized protein n=1 Tax=Parvularcula marina TaxID=2292771 RepID=A0A371RKU0_9PROT|nr:DsrE family protein [Parvularcula marina]RFB06051.1 hypothetical protein DX908_12735 [Parvularcula marina]
MKLFVLAALFVFSGSAALAGPDDFTDGPVITGYGKVTNVEAATQLDAAQTFRVAFDTSKSGEAEVNRTINSAARFLNMQARAGVAPENIELAVVLHGKAVYDVTRAGPEAADGNPSTELISLLQAQGVRFIVCGQSAGYYDVTAQDLLPGVEMAVSAMTAHALLQQDGFTLNPF